MKRTPALFMTGVALLLCGCIAQPCGSMTGCPAPSAAYLAITDADKDSLGATMRRLSLQDRLDAYHDVYVRSGHPKTMLTWAFEGSGEAGFDAVVARMTDRRSFSEYFWIIHHLSVVGDLNVCEPRFFGPLSEKAANYNVVDASHPVPIDFGSCELVL